MKFKCLLIATLIVSTNIAFAQQDTLTIMTYNVLGYGDGCQGADNTLHAYLKTIVKNEHPDMLGFVKMYIQTSAFPDSVIRLAMDAAYPGEYNYCTYTNRAGSNDLDLLIYNQLKLGFVTVTTLASISEDFDLFKLYYKDPFLSITHDSTFIYVVLCHTISGSNPASRDQQDSAVERALANIFYHLPNLIYMGDFNTHGSGEAGYQFLVNNPDTNFTLSDPPFAPDGILKYPIDWGNTPTLAADELTTTTRLSATVPNSCGTSGGGKNWYDHILLSSWIVNNSDFVHYIKNSYKTIGNDGNRIGISVNDSVTHGKNTSVPPNVLNALFNFSDKYPVIIKLAISYDSNGSGPSNPVVNGINQVIPPLESIAVNNPIHNDFVLHLPSGLIGQKINMQWYDICGRLIYTEGLIPNNTVVHESVYFVPGMYLLRIQIGKYSVTKRIVQE